MKWDNTEQDAARKSVVRMLSFYKKAEDGDISPATSKAVPEKVNVRRTPSESGFTSIDLKKSRARTSSLLRQQLTATSTPLKPNLHKSSSFSVVARPSPIVPEANTQSLCRSKLRADPGRKINKLVLRVPSAACEYENKRIIHSVCVREGQVGDVGAVTEPQPEATKQKLHGHASTTSRVESDGSYAVSHLVDGAYFNFDDTTKVLAESELGFHNGLSKSESTTNLIPVTPRAKHRHRLLDFTKNGILHTISGDLNKSGFEPGAIDLPERWRNGASVLGTSSDVGSTSLSNFSSGDGLSTPTHMGSTTRLIYGNKSRSKWKCSWSEHFTTFLSIVSQGATFGNIVRLPRVVYFHGGGIFLLVYALITLIFGIPLVFLEIGLGQFCQHGNIKFWRAVNLLRGVGYVSVLLAFCTSVYYSVYTSISLAMLAWTAKNQLPLQECENMTEGIFIGEQCLNQTFLTPVWKDPLWFGLDVAFLFLLWVVILATMMRKSKSYKQVLCVVFPLLVAVLVALLAEASTRSTNGLSKLLTIEWFRLADFETWYFAFVEMFFSLQLGLGTISTSAGRVYPKSNAFWSSVAVVMVNLILGVAAVCLVYLWIDQLQFVEIQLPKHFQVPELFMLGVVYNVAVSCAGDLSTLWACFGYLLILLSGVSSLVMLAYTVLVAVAIETKRKWHWWHVASVFCTLAFFLGLISFLPTNLSLPHLLDHYTVSRSVVLVTCLQLVGFAYIYGCKNVYNDFEFVIGEKLCWYWRTAWVLTPLILLVLEVSSITALPLTGQQSEPDAIWEYSLGWALYFLSWLLVILCAFYQIYIQVDYNVTQKFLSSIKPSRNWGPVDPIYRHCWVQWRNRYNVTGQKDFTLKRRGTRDYTHSVRAATGDSVSVTNSYGLGGINPAATEWTYRRSTAATPYTLDTGGGHICWRKEDPR